MSLTTFLANKDVRKKFSEEFSMPKISLERDILAPPMTNHYITVGIAFDYLMRFYLQRLNPKTITRPWVAEHALEEVEHNKSLLRKVTKIIMQAKKDHSHYLKSGRMGRYILKTAMLLAPLDLIFRAGVIDKSIGRVDNKDIKDLKKLISIVDPTLFIAKKLCILNPTFGEGSELVGGADVDLVTDNTLIEIKTTKYWRLQRYHFNQIIGYYILSKIGGIDGAPAKYNIDRLGIYYSRYGELYTFPVKAVINEQKLPSFIKWFRKRAIAAGIAENQDALYPIFTELIRKEDDRVPPFVDFAKEKEVVGSLVAVRKVRNSDLVFLIIQRKRRKEGFPIRKSAASQIPIGSEIKICKGEKGVETYWRPRGLNDKNPKLRKKLEMLEKKIRKLKKELRKKKS